MEVNLEMYCISRQCDLFFGQVSFAEEFTQDQRGSAPTKTCNRSWNAAGMRDKFNKAYNRLWCGPNSPIILKTWSNSILRLYRNSPNWPLLLFCYWSYDTIDLLRSFQGVWRWLFRSERSERADNSAPINTCQFFNTKYLLPTLTRESSFFLKKQANVKTRHHLLAWSFVLPRK